MTFEEELSQLINRHSGENASMTPDFILAQYLTGCLEVWRVTTGQRDDWFGFKPFGRTSEDRQVKETGHVCGPAEKQEGQYPPAAQG